MDLVPLFGKLSVRELVRVSITTASWSNPTLLERFIIGFDHIITTITSHHEAITHLQPRGIIHSQVRLSTRFKTYSLPQQSYISRRPTRRGRGRGSCCTDMHSRYLQAAFIPNGLHVLPIHKDANALYGLRWLHSSYYGPGSWTRKIIVSHKIEKV